MTLGEKIKKLREQNNINQKEFARKMDISNVVLSRYESDERRPDYEVLQRIADYFSVTTDYLLGRTDQKNTPNDYEIQTIAAHHDGDEWTEEELEEIERFKEFVRMKRGNK